LLATRLRDAPAGADALALWRQLGIRDAERVPDLDAAAVRALIAN
jgi:malonate decarboxylase beta subunit